jgi:hypothetical protein
MTPDLLRRVGSALHGEQWQTPLAMDLNVPPRTVRRWLSGADTVPPGVRQELRQMLTEQRKSLAADLDTVDAVLRELTGEHNDR